MPNSFKKIAVLYGGPSSEAEVSKVTADAVCKAFDNLGLVYSYVEMIDDWLLRIATMKPDFVFLAVHGCPGEDGTVQGYLDLLGIPYNGSGVMASSLAMDKPRAKILFKSTGIGIAKEVIITPDMHDVDVIAAIKPLLPCVIKPASGGSSVGTAIVESENKISKGLELARRGANGGNLLVEEYIPGREFTVAIMGDRALEVTEIMPAGRHEFYDYDAKYADGGSVHKCPAKLMPEVKERMKRQALRAHQVLGCNGVTRADFRFDEETGRLVILEVNTLPGLTPTSLVPEQALECEMDFEQLVVWMIKNGVGNTCRQRQSA